MASNEEHPHDDSTNDGDIDGGKSSKGEEKEIKRGKTIMKNIIRDRDRGIKYDVHWSPTGQLIKPNASKLTSYSGTIVRREIPITCDEWRDDTLNDAKNKIWSEIQVLLIMSLNYDYVRTLCMFFVEVFQH